LADLPRLICGAALTIAVAAAPFVALAKTTDKSPYILVDVDSGMVLADRQADQPWYPASLTKLMTAYVTFRAMAVGQVTSETRVVASATAAAQDPIRMGFDVGTKISLDNALKMMLVPSANDIAVAIAEGVGGGLAAFVNTMNAEAARLGLNKTRFENPNGLPAPGQVTTARDLAVLARQIWIEFPDHRPLFGIPAIASGGSVFHSPNLMLLERYRGTQGMKTGFTCEAGYNLAATATRDGRTLLAVVLGRTSSTDRAELAARLLNDGFAGKTPAVDLEPLDEFADPESGAGPIDMRICSGTGVDRVGFTDSALGPIVAVRDPIKVVTDTPPAPPKPPPAKPTKTAAKPAPKPAAKSGTTSTASTAKGKGTTSTASTAKGKGTTSTASAAKGKGTTSTATAKTSVATRLPTNEAPLAIAVPRPPPRERYRILGGDQESS
jgi:D-alanyl-D-alanine carboxypeptidase